MKNDYRGRLRQIPIYLGKCFRTFVYMDDWKVLPMAAVIGGLVSLVACQNMFVTMEGTTSGGFALICVCIWDGFFNSIQVICRERNIIKREHRSGMHISSYICAHLIYQAFLCLMQTLIIMTVCYTAGVHMPEKGIISDFFAVDMGITLFLVTFAADMVSLMISAVVTNPTSAMTVMPFVLIVQLVFSGTMFILEGPAELFTKLTISKWGMDCLCSIGQYNSLPVVGLWNQIFKCRDLTIAGVKPVELVTNYMMDNKLVDEFCLQAGAFNQKANYLSTRAHVADCWGILIIMAAVCAILATLALERIDRDKR